MMIFKEIQEGQWKHCIPLDHVYLEILVQVKNDRIKKEINIDVFEPKHKTPLTICARVVSQLWEAVLQSFYMNELFLDFHRNLN